MLAAEEWWIGAESLIYGQLKPNLLFTDLAKIPERRGATRHPAFMVLVLIKEKRGGESKVFFH